MIAKAEEYRNEARRLQKRAEAAADEGVRHALSNVARRWFDIANDTERYELDTASTHPPMLKQARD
jgi:hypothetical protein